MYIDGDMFAAKKMIDNHSFSLISENIPESMLPVLYYIGDGDYMILATHHILFSIHDIMPKYNGQCLRDMDIQALSSLFSQAFSS